MKTYEYVAQGLSPPPPFPGEKFWLRLSVGDTSPCPKGVSTEHNGRLHVLRSVLCMPHRNLIGVLLHFLKLFELFSL